jgi:hypothetical protein
VARLHGAAAPAVQPQGDRRSMTTADPTAGADRRPRRHRPRPRRRGRPPDRVGRARDARACGSSASGSSATGRSTGCASAPASTSRPRRPT